MPFTQNPLLRTDSYKISQWKQYPKDSKRVYSYLSSRGGFFDHVLWFGLQAKLKSVFTGKVFNADNIEHARAFCRLHFNSDKVFNYNGFKHLLERHDGKLPLRICAPPEGMLVPIQNAMMTVEATDDNFPWLTNYWETQLLQGTWYSSTVATLSFELRQAIGKDLIRSGTPEALDLKLQDFGYRGVSSNESAGIGGASHLINFHGTDTLAGIEYLMQYYKAGMAGFSIPAMEHSTVTSWGKEFEADSYENMMDQYPDGWVALVIDSYDTLNAVENIFGNRLREKILRRNGTVVLRPDSGNPVEILEDIFNSLAEKFGFETNSKGYKVLPSQVRVIWGDGINYQNILRINSDLIKKGWSLDNWGYGMGGALLQQVNRDTMRWALKCSAINRAGVWYEVKKEPKTDLNKSSTGGRFSLVDRSTNGSGDFTTVREPNVYGNILDTVFEDGTLKKEVTYDEVWNESRKHDRYVKEAEKEKQAKDLIFA